MSVLYEKDFYAWCLDQCKNLKEKDLLKMDIENLIEEIESMGKSLKSELVNRLAILICHILKWKYQPNLRCNSWKYIIREQRERIANLLEDSPSLTNKDTYENCLSEAYSYGTNQAAGQTGISRDTFPESLDFDPLNIKEIN